MFQSTRSSTISRIGKLSCSYQPSQLTTFLQTFKFNPTLRISSTKSFSSTLRKSQHSQFSTSLSSQFFNKTIQNTKPTLRTQRHCLSTISSPPQSSSTSAPSVITQAIKSSDQKVTSNIELPRSFPKFKSFEEFFSWYKIDPPTSGYERFSPAWWASMSWLMLMYSATGYTALTVVRGLFKLNGIDNVSLFQGETHHRIVYFLLMTPTYSLLTLVFGRIFGRPQYSDNMFKRIWKRFLPFLFKK